MASSSTAGSSRPHSPTLSERSLDDVLPWKRKIGYGMGHILNDLCASMWFTYLLLFFHRVLQFDNVYAGVILFTGQIADGLSTLFVGYFSDNGDDLWLCNKYGKRKSWHLIGTLCVLISFPFIFVPCVGCSDADDYAQMIYYAAFVILFQFGWASTQISHLAMIPELSTDQNERTGLTAIRYGMTVAANITVYLVTWIFLGIGSQDSMLGPDDAGSFRNIMIVCVTLGGFASLLFHTLVRIQPFEAMENRMNSAENLRPRQGRKITTKDWLLEPQFYQVAGAYMTTRLFVNLTQAYIPLYLQVSPF